MHSAERISDADGFAAVMERVTSKANAKTVFGEPVIIGDRAVIPVARIAYSGGGGFGSGSGNAECGPECSPDCEGEHSEGSGMGLGFMVQAKPVGTIEVTEYDVSFKPIVDYSSMAQVWTMVGAAVAVAFAVKSLLLSR